MPENRQESQSPFGKEEGLKPLDTRTELNYNKDIGQGRQNTLDSYTGEKKPVIKRPPIRPAIPERPHAFHYMERFSWEAYTFIKNEGIIDKRQAQMMDFLMTAQYQITDREWVGATGIEINVITPRRGELLFQEQIIEFKCDKLNVSGREASAWGLITDKLPKQVWEPEYFAKSDLYRRYWTDRLIASLLKKPDDTADNPYNPAWAPMKLYRKYRVFLAEKCPEFQQRLRTVEARA